MSDKRTEHVQRMYRYAHALEQMIQSGWLTREKLGRSYHLQMEVAMHFQIVGEAAAKLLRLGFELDPDIPLVEVVGLRNRVSHDYEGLNWTILEDAVFEDIPVLAESLRNYMDAHDIQRDEIALDDELGE